ncbi:MAG: redoxin domain-containing protein, partial [Rubrivivax sp.]|nr:redoxin domain-containing protein [Rubrivivax sp.]
MNKLLLAAAVATTLGLATGAARANATVGQPAPAFTATDTSGKAVSLADFKGKHVVLEWVNPGCPYVVKHYG